MKRLWVWLFGEHGYGAVELAAFVFVMLIVLIALGLLGAMCCLAVRALV